MSAHTMTAYDGAVLPCDLDGDPYRDFDGLGPWKMTPCCGAAATGGDGGIYCKHCWEPTMNDGPARLQGAPAPLDRAPVIVVRVR